jgi:hypothetical protein
VENIIQILHFSKQGIHLAHTMEKVYFYEGTKRENQLNDKHNIQPNRILETILDIEPHDTR